MPTNFGATPTSTTTLGNNQFPVSAGYVPGSSGALTSIQLGPSSTDGGGYTSAPVAVYQATGSNLHVVVDSGSITDSGTVTANQGGSWTVTANIGTTNGLALDTSINGILLAQGSTTSGEKGPLIQGAVTTGSPSYTTAQTSPFSLTTAGALRVDASATTQPISAASLPLPSGAATSAKQPAPGAAGNASSDVLTVQGIASMTALKVDGSGVTQPVSGTFWQTTQPVSGTVTANIGTTNGLALDATVAKLNVAQGAALGSNTGPMMQGSVTTNAPTYVTGNINPLSLDTSGLLRASLKDTPSNTNNLNVNLAASAATVTVAGSGNFAVTQATGTNLHTVVDSGTITANQGGSNWSVNVAQVAGGTASNAGQTGAMQVGGAVATNTVVSSATNPLLIAGSDYGGTPKVQSLKVDSSGNAQVAVTNTPTVTANAGTNLNTSLLALETGGNLATLAGGVASSKYQINNAQVAGTTISVDSGTSGSGTQRMIVAGAATGTKTNVASSATSVTILAANTSRKGATLYNDSTQVCYLDLSGGTASNSSYSVQVPAQGYFELPGPTIYNGAITGIWAAANGNMRVTEFS